MGWDSCSDWDSKQDVITACEQELGSNLIHKTECEDGLWCLVHDDLDKANYICIFLIEEENGSWFSKKITESSFPYAFNCPVEYLEKAPCACKEWRDIILKG